MYLCNEASLDTLLWEVFFLFLSRKPPDIRKQIQETQVFKKYLIYYGHFGQPDVSKRSSKSVFEHIGM